MKTKWISGLGLVLFSSVSCVTNNKNSISDKPNVLFIAIDDINDWVGCLGGHPDVKTPNLDRLAQKGVLFTSAHCSAPICNPSRVSLLTGLLPSTSGIYHNPHQLSNALKKNTPLTQYFKENGYIVMGSGKIYHDNNIDTAHWSSYRKVPLDSNAFIYPLNTAPRGILEDWRIGGGPMYLDEEEFHDTQLANWAVSQLNLKHDDPFFLAVGFWHPHLHWFAPRKYFDLYPLDKVTLPLVNNNDWDDLPPLAIEIARCINDHENILENNQWEKAVAAYLACISYVDALVGRVLDALEKSPYASNTIVVVWGDNGFSMGEKLHWQKFSLWEEGTRVPLMIYAPGYENRMVAKPVSLLDIYPTLVDLCGLPSNQNLEGLSLKPLMENPDIKWERPALTTYGRNNHSLRTIRWRYTRYEDGTEELYDHSTDPNEWDNLASDPKYVDLKQKLSKWFPHFNSPNAPDGKGNTDIPFWHKEYSFLEGRPIKFLY